MTLLLLEERNINLFVVTGYVRSVSFYKIKQGLRNDGVENSCQMVFLEIGRVTSLHRVRIPALEVPGPLANRHLEEVYLLPFLGHVKSLKYVTCVSPPGPTWKLLSYFPGSSSFLVPM